MKTAIITGSAGFIGFHLSQKLLGLGYTVVGIDNLNTYYDVNLKLRRNEILALHNSYHFYKVDLLDVEAVRNAFKVYTPDVVVHLAAQAGVRFSIEKPEEYLNSNVVGSFNIMELAREYATPHLLMASTSSVYGANTEMPFNEHLNTDTPLSFYAATKKATEAMAHSYSHTFGLSITMFRFFTVYGPWGRPDMALFKFAENMRAGKKISVFNHGNMQRDFTYIDDLVEAIYRLSEAPPNVDGPKIENDTISPVANFRVVNIGNGEAVPLMRYIAELEKWLGIEADKEFLPMQIGDVPKTWCDPSLLYNITGFRPSTRVGDGVRKFVDWYLEYQK